MSDIVLSASDLTIDAFNARGTTRRVLDQVSFTLERKRILGIIGESGAGKSTLGLAALGHFRAGLRHAGGRMALGGTDLLTLGEQGLSLLRGTRIAYVAQSAAAAFTPSMRLLDQVVETAVARRLMSARDAAMRAVDLFELLGLPDPARFGQRYPHQVSGGQLQRAMTAMALCSSPDVIVFDEPTTALDADTRKQVLATVRHALHKTGTAALYISHDLATVADIADDMLVLRDGRMVEYGPTRRVIEAPQSDYTQRLLNVSHVARAACDVVDEGLAELPQALAVEHVTASYANGVPVLKDVSFGIPAGRTLAVVGQSGSGKSSLARVVSGLLRPSSGRVWVNGRLLAADYRKRSKAELRAVQLIHQLPDVALNPRHTVREAIGRPLTFYFGLRGEAREQRIVALAEQVELDAAILDRYPHQLSGGQKQRVCIARAFAAEPTVLVCDEPTSALDPLVGQSVLALFSRLQREAQIAVLFITHDLATVRAIADSVLLIEQGTASFISVAADFPAPELKAA
ncbi:ABC transporter ATP-binding protein [Xylophilus sp. GW821-FHT01B05]